MPVIRQLDPHLADLIAAGEVVERPASVVKELTENAIDAGAHSVTVEIEHGGMTLIRVTDDGCGIPAAEAATAFLRHATSKIATEYDLEAIGTLGFRGEALAAIAAVSRVELLTRPADAGLGTRLVLEGGRVAEQEEAGCPGGTMLAVRDLFFNTPARLKFMKKDAAEGAAVLTAVQRLALSHPEVALRFVRDGRTELTTPGDGRLKSAVYAVLGRDIAMGFTEVGGSGEGMTVTGFASMPACCRGSRGYQYFFVNGRHVKNSVMTAALEEAYKNQKMVGRFPGCVLHLTTGLGSVDVNVHPAKTEVKFRSDQEVFTAVHYAVLAALNGNAARPQAALFPQTGEKADPAAEQLAMSFRDPTAAQPAVSAPPPARPVPPSPPTEEHDAPAEKPVWKPAPTYRPAPRGSAARPAVRPSAPATGEAPRFRRVTPLPPEPPVPEELLADAPVRRTRPTPPPAAQSAPPPPPPAPVREPEREGPPAAVPAQEELPWAVRGELFNTYIMVEQGEKVILIDKHAAHERANFDRLKAADYQPMAQELLAPVVFTPAPEEREALLERTELLGRFGFELEEFGTRELAVRTAPDYLDAGELEGALTELARRILDTGSADPDAARDELLHTMACKAAIKGGQQNGPAELEQAARLVMSGAVRYCPHGRPVAIELTKKQLEKQFKRT